MHSMHGWANEPMHNPTYDDLVRAATSGLVVLAVHDNLIVGGFVFAPGGACRHPSETVRAKQHVLATRQVHARTQGW